jgi:hypothetical protein
MVQAAWMMRMAFSMSPRPWTTSSEVPKVGCRWKAEMLMKRVCVVMAHDAGG